MKSIAKHFSIIYRHQSIIINHKFKKYGLGSGQYIFFINIAENEGITHIDLSNNLKIDSANTTRAIKKLEEMDYISVVTNDCDRRKKQLYLTDYGRSILPSVKSELASLTEILAKGLSSEERDYLLKIFETIEFNLDDEINNIKIRKGNKD